MWLKPKGYAVITAERPSEANLDGFQHEKVREGINEYDTFCCGHCNRIIHVRARQRAEDIGGLCYQCMRPICPACVETGHCDPLEKKLARWEDRERTLRSYGL